MFNEILLNCVNVQICLVSLIAYVFGVIIISDPRRGRYMVLSAFIFFSPPFFLISFFFFFFHHDFVRTISLEPSLTETPD